MSSSYCIVVPKIWDDDRFAELSVEGKLVFLFILTGAQSQQVPGLLWCGPAALAEGLRMAPDAVERAMQELTKTGLIEVDAVRRVIRAKRAPKYNPPGNGNVVRAWFRAWKILPESPLKYKHVSSLQEVVENRSKHHTDAWEETFATIIDSCETVPQSMEDGCTNGSPNRSVIPRVCVSVSSLGSNLDLDIENTEQEPGQAKKRQRRKTPADPLAAHRPICERLWDMQEQLRAQAIPGSMVRSPGEDRLRRIAQLLALGKTESECVHVLRVYAEEARQDEKSAKWFDGVSNWRPENFERALGRRLAA